MGSAGTPQMSPAQLNMYQRQAVLGASVEMTQQIFSQTIAAPIAGNNVLNIVPRNVGLIKRFIVEVAGNLVNTDGAAASLATVLGLSNVLSNVSFFDLNNNQRINTTGWHLAILKQMKNRHMAPNVWSKTPTAVDSLIADEFNQPVFPVVTYTPPAKGATQAFRAVFEIPLAYSDDDLRGAVYANVINATMQLQLTLNPNPFSGAGTDSTLNVVTFAGNFTNVTVTVYQVYLDQLPVGKNGVVLPIVDLSTIYELKTTNFNPVALNQDFPIPYANFRDFLSTTAIFNSTGLTAGLTAGTDINYWALQSANFTNIWKIDPLLAAQRVREILGGDIGHGIYYFSHRRKPISTTQYGNMELILNASVAAAASYLLIGWEDFALVNTLTQAGSLAA